MADRGEASGPERLPIPPRRIIAWQVTIRHPKYVYGITIAQFVANHIVGVREMPVRAIIYAMPALSFPGVGQAVENRRGRDHAGMTSSALRGHISDDIPDHARALPNLPIILVRRMSEVLFDAATLAIS